jgi:hypothetical protein
MTDAATQTSDYSCRQLISSKTFALDPKAFHYYTGLENYDKFYMILCTLGPAAYNLNYFSGVKPSLSVEDQFFSNAYQTEAP